MVAIKRYSRGEYEANLMFWILTDIMNIMLSHEMTKATSDQCHYTEIDNCWNVFLALRWRHKIRDSVSNHQSHDCLLNRVFRCRSKKTSKLRVTGLCAGNSPVTGEFPAQMASNAENVSIWWRHHEASILYTVSMRSASRDIDGLVQDCSISSALAMEILQSCTKPSMCTCQPGKKLLYMNTVYIYWTL